MNSTITYLNPVLQKVGIFIFMITFMACGNKKSPPTEKANEKTAVVKADTSTVLAYEQKLIDAYKKADVETIAGLYDDDLVFNSPNGQVLSKTDDLESIRSGVLRIETYDPNDYLIKLNGDVAAVSVLIHIKGKVADNEFAGYFRFLRVWKRQNDNWKVIAISGYQIK